MFVLAGSLQASYVRTTTFSSDSDISLSRPENRHRSPAYIGIERRFLVRQRSVRGFGRHMQKKKKRSKAITNTHPLSSQVKVTIVVRTQNTGCSTTQPD